ncbi:hypothetical protein BHM03_00006808, partial [Ensete ventricosum]
EDREEGGRPPIGAATHSQATCKGSHTGATAKRGNRLQPRVPIGATACGLGGQAQPRQRLPGSCRLQGRPTLMAKTKPGKKDLDSYTIKSANKVVKEFCVRDGVVVGDCVLMRPAESGKPPYVARVEKIEADHRNNVRVRVRWYYRPEESIGGRRQFHGAKELFLSDHYDVQSAHTIEGKCIVHSFKNYTKLENVGAEDYFCRFEYKAGTGAFTPDRIAV